MVNKLCQDINQIVSEWPKPRLHFVPMKSDSMAPKIRFCSEIFLYTEQYHCCENFQAMLFDSTAISTVL